MLAQVALAWDTRSMNVDVRGNISFISRALIGVLASAVLAGCVTAPNRPARPARSSYECMQSVVQEKLPAGLPDARAHCLAAGLIARYCSGSEAYMAGLGKELRDLFGAGDANWEDWRADRAGIGCARRAGDDEALAQCCSERGY
ncbi:hypothetical protein JM946_25085 [Steroidobacter sp. S1-65]|uniref:Lipoprotein n=1 Tax=Steroidobacter gossypii TaxID=2805490 RepID=A0ABS1X470_9GAMM|nr:hypothetical protein [Steroidobacter gossypii]MBM0108019.1 hypothetical protein [Steroidobacter gossypii]